MITVWLYGALADQFGKKYVLDVKSPAEAVMALEANNPGRFKQALIGNSYQISRGKTFEEGEGDTVETLRLQRAGLDIHFVPVIEGAKSNGVFQVIVGVVLIVVGAVLSYVGQGWIGGPMMKMGFAMVVGGVVQMLTPTADISGLNGVSEAVDPRKSFIFTGAQNVAAQGVCVPVCYGEFEVGSVVISQSLTAERI